eukprot:gene11650-13065_t
MASRRPPKLPTLMKLTPAEAQCVSKMFRLFDGQATGKVPAYAAEKIAKELGLRGIYRTLFPNEITLNDLLLALDAAMPEPEPVLLSALTTFTHLEGIESEADPAVAAGGAVGGAGGLVITPEVIVSFMQRLGRPPASLSEASLLLNAMLDYDDCSEVPRVSAQTFARDLITFAKKHNAFKDYRPTASSSASQP